MNLDCHFTDIDSQIHGSGTLFLMDLIIRELWLSGCGIFLEIIYGFGLFMHLLLWPKPQDSQLTFGLISYGRNLQFVVYFYRLVVLIVISS